MMIEHKDYDPKEVLRLIDERLKEARETRDSIFADRNHSKSMLLDRLQTGFLSGNAREIKEDARRIDAKAGKQMDRVEVKVNALNEMRGNLRDIENVLNVSLTPDEIELITRCISRWDFI